MPSDIGENAVVVGEGVSLTKLEDGRIIVILSPGEFGLSSSGKSFRRASTGGNITVPGTALKLGVNLYEAVPAE